MTRLLEAVCVLALLTPALAHAQDRALNVTTSPVYSIGGSNAPEWAEFTDVRGAAFGPTGELWLVDTRGRRIIRVAADGKSGQDVMRRGRGPGEFETPFGITAQADGKVAIGDLMQGTLQLLDAQGALVTTMRRPGVLRAADVSWLEGNDYVAVPRLYSFGDGRLRLSTDEDQTLPQELPLVRFKVESTPTPDVIARAKLLQPPASNVQFKTHAFHPRVQWDAYRGRIAVVDDATYRVSILDAQGKTIGTLTRAIEPRRPSRADMRAVRAHERTRLIRPDGSPNVGGVSMSGGARPDPSETVKRIENGLEAMTFADVVPVIQGVKYDRDGRLWVARTADVWGEPPTFDVFNAAGSYLGSTRALPRLPDAFGPNGLAAYIEKDSDDVPVVRVVKITLQ